MIHYHGTPLSGGDSTHLALQGKHCFVSHAASDCLPVVAELCQSFALDNGAFSHWKKSGGEIDLVKLAEWLGDWYRHPGFDFYVVPDVIDGSEERNREIIGEWDDACSGYPRMMERGYPVWHLHESLDWLYELAELYPGVCFGSSGEFAEIGTSAWCLRMAEAMEVVTDDDGRPLTRLHGLRMLDPTVFSHYPFSSADSTNVARNCGLDNRWKGTYAPRSAKQKALIMMERIESHASAARWNNESSGVSQNFELFG